MPKIALAQIEFKTAGIDHQLSQISNAIEQALEQNADIIVFPELILTGYFVGDLIDQADFQKSHHDFFQRFLIKTKQYPILIILGDVLCKDSSQEDGKHKQYQRYNSAYIIDQGQIVLTYHKNQLPNYGVFDEKRYFKPSSASSFNNSTNPNTDFKQILDENQDACLDQFLWVEKDHVYHIHLAICEDLWHPLADDYFHPVTKKPPQQTLNIPYIKHPLITCQQALQSINRLGNIKEASNQIADDIDYKRVIISLNASPFELGKHKKRLNHLHQHAQQFNTDIIYVNSVGMCDEVLFDGQSMIIETHNNQSITTFQANAFKDGVFVFDWAQNHTLQKNQSFKELKRFNDSDDSDDPDDPDDSINFNQIGSFPDLKKMANHRDIKDLTDGLIYAIKSYAEYSGFQKVVLGLSGGVDSALVAVLATNALGAENVHAIMMPSPYTADISKQDAYALAKNLNISYQEISIESILQQYEKELTQNITSNQMLQSITLENLQARIRGQILMAYSNQNNTLLLATGNKSELAMGYCTLYGDMAGGFAPIKDLYKTQVYAVCDYLNQASMIIPERILSRAPSAELKPNQKDQDSLPPYAVLDLILESHIEYKTSAQVILKKLLEALNHLTNQGTLFVEDVQIFAENYLQKTPAEQLNWLQIYIQKIYQNEYKRRQGALGPKVNQVAFARDWRVPMTHAFDFRKMSFVI
jgi:NAD+ synthase (glutamine-hydrolysing)